MKVATLPSLTPEQMTTISDGRPLVIPHPDGDDRVLAVVKLAASPIVAWTFCCNWEHVGDFVPAVNYRVLARARDGELEQLSIAGEARVAFVRVNYVVRAHFDHARQTQEWRLATAEQLDELAKQGVTAERSSVLIRDIRGSARIEAAAGGCLFIYENLLVPSAFLPSAIEQFLSRRAMHDFLAALNTWFRLHPAAGHAAQPQRAEQRRD